ncbi:MAG: mechanosensitive ion channel family protein [bacterium]
MENYFSEELLKKLYDSFSEWIITKLPAVLLILVLGFIGVKFLNYALKQLKRIILHSAAKEEQSVLEERTKRADTLMGVVKIAGNITIWSIVLMIVLKKIGIDIAPLIAGVGIVGLALGFGAQELVRDIISGFFMLLEDHVRTGDVAILNGTGGLVENINLRTITLRDFAGVVHVFQNGKINSMSNMTKEWSAMVFDIGVAYKEDTDKVAEVMKTVGEELYGDPEFKDMILEPIEIFGVDNFADSAVVVKARIKTKPIKQWTVGREYRRRLKKAFDSERIEIPFPHQTIYWGEETKPLKVDGLVEKK